MARKQLCAGCRWWKPLNAFETLGTCSNDSDVPVTLSDKGQSWARSGYRQSSYDFSCSAWRDDD